MLLSPSRKTTLTHSLLPSHEPSPPLELQPTSNPLQPTQSPLPSTSPSPLQEPYPSLPPSSGTRHPQLQLNRKSPLQALSRQVLICNTILTLLPSTLQEEPIPTPPPKSTLPTSTPLPLRSPPLEPPQPAPKQATSTQIERSNSLLKLSSLLSDPWISLPTRHSRSRRGTRVGT